MQNRLLIIALLSALGMGVSFASAGSGLLGGFFGVFLGVFVGYTLLIALTHFFCLVLPKFGIGTDPRNEEEPTR
jgi:hypothetical protein